MNSSNFVHPQDALFAGEKPFPALSACEHFAGSEKLITKAMQLQAERGPIFDITCDCEDGARAGEEEAHAHMVARLVGSDANRYGKVGVRIHDPVHPAWRRDVEVIVDEVARQLAYVTIPKSSSTAQVAEVIDLIQKVAQAGGRTRPLPVHVLIETHGALRDVSEIAQLPFIEVLDFGLMDFVSGHHGAIPASAMRSPGQFEHQLIVRAKAEVSAAALANGIVPAHNVCVNLKDRDVIKADAKRARDEFGFQRMWSIHPDQIVPIVEAMQPEFEEVSDAGKILLAAQEAGWGPIQFKGELHDRATYRYYWSVLEKAQATGVALSAQAEQRFFG